MNYKHRSIFSKKNQSINKQYFINIFFEKEHPGEGLEPYFKGGKLN